MKKKYWILIASIFLIIATLSYFIFSNKLLLSPEQNSNLIQEKEIKIIINEDGTSSEFILWKIKVPSFSDYLLKEDWEIYIPKESKEIKVHDSKNQIEFKIREVNDKYSILTFKNKKNIYYGTDYFFNISYTVEKNPLVIEPNCYYKRTFTKSPLENSFNISIYLPEDAGITYLSKEPASNDYQNPLNYILEESETASIEIDFVLPEKNLLLSPDLVEISSNYYTAEVPQRYAKEFSKILSKAEKGIIIIEQIYGFNSPHKWKIELVTQNEVGFEEQTNGIYLGEGKIKIKSTNLQKTEKEILYILLHETVHGFNSVYFKDNVPNFWWEEGTAQYISYKALESLEYNTSELKKETSALLNECNSANFSFISSWSPNIFFSNETFKKINCSGKNVSPISLGYAQSYNIIDALSKKYGEEIFKKTYDEIKKENITMSSSHEILNNQINYVLTLSSGEDTTLFLNSFGLEVKAVNPKDETSLNLILNGMGVFNE